MIKTWDYCSTHEYHAASRYMIPETICFTFSSLDQFKTITVDILIPSDQKGYNRYQQNHEAGSRRPQHSHLSFLPSPNLGRVQVGEEHCGHLRTASGPNMMAPTVALQQDSLITEDAVLINLKCPLWAHGSQTLRTYILPSSLRHPDKF